MTDDFAILGIDPGALGAFAFLWPARARLVVFDMPMYETTKTKTRRFVEDSDVTLLIESYPLAHAFIEDVHARPDDGAVSAFNFGQRYGTVLGVLAGKKIPRDKVAPNVWKKSMRAPADKKQSVARAKELFPACAALFNGPRGGLKDGRAEAAMIALYGALSLGHRLTASVQLLED